MEDKLKESQIHTSNLHTSSGSLSKLSLIFTACTRGRRAWCASVPLQLHDQRAKEEMMVLKGLIGLNGFR